MRALNLPRFLSCLVIGLLVPLSPVKAWDDNNLNDSSYYGENGATPVDDRSPAKPQGAQGPIRTDLAESEAVGGKNAVTKQKSFADTFAYPNDDNHYPFTEGG